MLNQNIIDVCPFTRSMQNDIIAISTYSNTREPTDKYNKIKYYNFIIDDKDNQDYKKELTVYQHLKQRNFAGDDSLQKRLLIKVVDRLDSKQKIINKQSWHSNVGQRYSYEQVQFEPLLASTVMQDEGSSSKGRGALISVYLYSRVDLLHSSFSAVACNFTSRDS